MKEKKYLMVDYYIVDKVLDKIGIEKVDDANILISSDNKFSDNIILKRVVILITCVLKMPVHFVHSCF